MSKEEGKQKRIEDGYWKLMGLNEDRIAIVNAPILHKIEYYYKLLDQKEHSIRSNFTEYVIKEIENTKKTILKLVYDNYKNTPIDDRVFDYLYDEYKDNEEALKILDDMKKETSKLKR